MTLSPTFNNRPHWCILLYYHNTREWQGTKVWSFQFWHPWFIFYFSAVFIKIFIKCLQRVSVKKGRRNRKMTENMRMVSRRTQDWGNQRDKAWIIDYPSSWSDGWRCCWVICLGWRGLKNGAHLNNGRPPSPNYALISHMGAWTVEQSATSIRCLGGISGRITSPDFNLFKPQIMYQHVLPKYSWAL